MFPFQKGENGRKKGVSSPKQFWNPAGWPSLGFRAWGWPSLSQGRRFHPLGCFSFFFKSSTCLQLSSLSVYDARFKIFKVFLENKRGSCSQKLYQQCLSSAILCEVRLNMRIWSRSLCRRPPSSTGHLLKCCPEVYKRWRDESAWTGILSLPFPSLLPFPPFLLKFQIHL